MSFVIVQHVLILRCMYVPTVCQSHLGPGAYQVMSYASAALRVCRVVTWFVPAHVSRGYMVCARERVTAQVY